MRAIRGTRVTRREFTLAAGSALASIAFGDACAVSTRTAPGADARLSARPSAGDVTASMKTGDLGLGRSGRDGVFQLPSNPPAGKMPLLLFLHGATQRGAGMLRRIGPAADRAGVAVLAPDSRETTWDAIRGDFGVDVAFLNGALAYVFEHVAVDPARVTIGGFSDGATYAIALGLANGDLFQRVVAFSPGFVIGAGENGRPRLFVSHGTADQILPIDQTSRMIVPRLRSRGYDVTFREFDGRHDMPADVVTDAFKWMAG